MKGFLVDVSSGTAEEVKFKDKLEKYYKMLSCQRIDIVSRSIDGVQFDIVCDDEALLKDSPLPSALYSNGKPALFGNLLFCNHDGEGNEASLTDRQIAILKQHTVPFFYGDRIFNVIIDIEFMV